MGRQGVQRRVSCGTWFRTSGSAIPQANLTCTFQADVVLGGFRRCAANLPRCSQVTSRSHASSNRLRARRFHVANPTVPALPRRNGRRSAETTWLGGGHEGTLTLRSSSMVASGSPLHWTTLKPVSTSRVRRPCRSWPISHSGPGWSAPPRHGMNHRLRENQSAVWCATCQATGHKPVVQRRWMLLQLAAGSMRSLQQN